VTDRRRLAHRPASLIGIGGLIDYRS